MKRPSRTKNQKTESQNASRSGFSEREAMLLERLGHEAEGAVFRNDDVRVFETLGEALRLAAARAGKRRVASAKRRVASDFAAHSGFDLTEACHEYVTAGVNLERFQEALATLENVVRAEVVVLSELAADVAELLTRVGRCEEAERTMLAELDRQPDGLKAYLALGDIYYHWQEQEELRDYALAEEWFFKAFDRGLGRGASEESHELIDHLGDVCFDRLRQEAEQRFLSLLLATGRGDWRTVANLREAIWHEGAGSRFLRHLARLFGEDEGGDSLTSPMTEQLRALFGFYEHMPQDNLGGYSAFERTELFPPGRQEMRIMHDLAEAYARTTGDHSVNFSLYLSDDFVRFQKTFMEGADPVTGKRRAKVVSDERSETRQRHEDGATPWLGFLKFRRGPARK
jgi:tetratricopeptide (TPR) repeat protein